MGFSEHPIWLAALLCLLCMGGEVRGDCTEDNMEMEGGDYILTKQLKSGSTLIYNCPEGYYPYPALTRVCQGSGSWKPSPKRFQPQKCRLVECPDPNVLEYGSIYPPQEKYFVDNETTVECYSGYTRRGSAGRVCLPNGKWSGNTPICSRDTGDDCADPGIPPGAMRTGNMFGVGDIVTYSCNRNMFLMGSSERKCLENGQWTGIEPACYFKHTYDTPLEVSQAFGSAIKDTLTTLEPVEDIQGKRKIRIQKNGTLNIYIAVDISESIDEKYVQNSKEAVKMLVSKISSFTVTPNYEIVFFSSKITEVVKITDFLEKIPVNIVEKLDAFERSDADTGTDLNSVFTTFYAKMSFIKTRVGEETFKEHRHVIIVFTDGAFNMGGSPIPTVTKIKNLVYMNHTVEGETKTQPRDDYLDIYMFGIGNDIYESDLKALTAGSDGAHFFKLKNTDTLKQTFDEIIDEGELVGLCGLHRDYLVDGEITRKMFPWVAFINIQNEKPNNCLGSLVTEQFVLTAAHCFSFGDAPEHVTVEIDDGFGKIKKVKNFFLHPNYNINAKKNEGVNEFYDYDVALIQLKEDVKISSSVRPICIPCTEETNGALKLHSNSECKQQEELLLKNHLERLSFLSKKSNWVFEKDVRAKLGSNRDACIRHALEAPGVTTKDPKIVVTDNFLCTGGRTYYRDHIACNGDSGSAVFKNYYNRTIQVALVSWGTKDICKLSKEQYSDDSSRDFHINLFRVVPFLKSILGNNDQNDYRPLNFLSS